MGRQRIGVEFAGLSELGDTPLLTGADAPADAAVSRSQLQPNEAADQSGQVRRRQRLSRQGSGQAVAVRMRNRLEERQR